MASTISYGEVIYETSRAFADDEDEDADAACSVALQMTEFGAQFVKQVSESEPSGRGLLCVFHGKVAAGFGQGFLNSKSGLSGGSNYDTLGRVAFVGKEGTVDSLLERPRKKVAATVVQIKSKPGSSSAKSGALLFALIDSYGIPRSYSYEIMEQLEGFMRGVKQVVVFHNEPLALFHGRQAVADGQLFYVRNNAFKVGWLPKGAKLLEQPNLVSGVSASVMSHCEMVDQPALLLISYSDTDLVDSISVKPFLDATTVAKTLSEPSGDNGDDWNNFSLAQYFNNSSSAFNIASASKTNLSHVSQSNLYI